MNSTFGTATALTDGTDAKIDLNLLKNRISFTTDIHQSRRRALSITQCTERGTTYKTNDFYTIARLAKQYDLKVHIDGARMVNAIAGQYDTIASGLNDQTWFADAVSLGFIKSGGQAADLLVVFDQNMATRIETTLKSMGHLYSKSECWAAQILRLMDSGEWLNCARTANCKAKKLESALVNSGIEIEVPVESNAVFVRLSHQSRKQLRANGWTFRTYEDETSRFMTHWQTENSDIKALCSALRNTTNRTGLRQILVTSPQRNGFPPATTQV